MACNAHARTTWIDPVRLVRPVVTAIVCAYNEARRIGEVLRVLTAYPFARVIVVDDGSSDPTSEVASSFENVTVIRHDSNRGKGQAMTTGVEAAETDIIVFFDADITGLDVKTVHAIVQPVVDGRTEMMVGVCHRWAYALPWVLVLTAHLSGQRALTRKLWNDVPPLYKRGFKIEAALNYYATRDGARFLFRSFPGMGHVTKERKQGLFKGSASRIRMVAGIISVYVQLHF